MSPPLVDRQDLVSREPSPGVHLQGSSLGSDRSWSDLAGSDLAASDSRGATDSREAAVHAGEKPEGLSLDRRYDAPICNRECRFVKRVNTTYCALLLGQSQDVD